MDFAYVYLVVLSLYTDIAPRRTSDFVNIKINANNTDDKSYNYLIFTRTKKVFIFNVWKMQEIKRNRMIK